MHKQRWRVSNDVIDTMVSWDDGLIVFHPMTGETLCLTQLAKDIVTQLESTPCTSRQLMNRLNIDFDYCFKSGDDLELEKALHQLAHKDVVEPC